MAVDLQVNGYKGTSFSSPDLTFDAAAEACRAYLRDSRCAAFLPTVMTAPLSVYRANLPVLARVAELDDLRHRVLGLHLEGPFISPEPGAVGAHRADCVLAPDTELFDELQRLAGGKVRMLTLAAEVPGACHLIRHVVSRGVVAALGHQLASAREISAAAAAGASCVTHFGNALPNSIHRHNNPLWAALADDRLTVTLITDGFHLPPDLITAAIKAKGCRRCAVISDISPIGGCPPGRYAAGGSHGFGDDVSLEECGRLHVPSRQCLAGSSRNVSECVSHLQSLRVVTPEQLRQITFDTPLTLLGIDPQCFARAQRIPAARI
eukprot:TRINITY_DN9878_c0_g2_i1.p1 TRINITY_DN9878_c0_g2~~TRINITY_DN9878_c0_g2_i1.p1  ORF type:complete len:322 (+),score=85.43 TRINITY_DN9878_c0_g2_i1:68-1033(+)